MNGDRNSSGTRSNAVIRPSIASEASFHTASNVSIARATNSMPDLGLGAPTTTEHSHSMSGRRSRSQGTERIWARVRSGGFSVLPKRRCCWSVDDLGLCLDFWRFFFLLIQLCILQDGLVQTGNTLLGTTLHAKRLSRPKAACFEAGTLKIGGTFDGTSLRLSRSAGRFCIQDLEPTAGFEPATRCLQIISSVARRPPDGLSAVSWPRLRRTGIRRRPGAFAPVSGSGP